MLETSHSLGEYLDDYLLLSEDVKASQSVASFPQVCFRCPVGTGCLEEGANLSTLPVSPGYYRTRAQSVIVDRCPQISGKDLSFLLNPNKF